MKKSPKVKGVMFAQDPGGGGVLMISTMKVGAVTSQYPLHSEVVGHQGYAAYNLDVGLRLSSMYPD